MPKILTIGNDEFEFPIEGENPGYGSEITDWAETVTEALSTVQKPNDIVTTSATIVNTPGTYSVPGFTFSTTEVISISCRYSVNRTTTGPTATYVETGFIEGYYDGTNWGISVRSIADAQLKFSITSGGQIQYTIASPLPGSSHTGLIVFEAKVINNF
jgi:hypothetical protein